MPGKKYTVLIIPEGSHRVRRFSVKRRFVRIAVFACLAVALILSAFSIGYFRTTADQQQLRTLKKQNWALRNQLRQVSGSLADLRRQLVVVAQNDAKVRVMAKLTRPKGDAPNGVGGPAEDVAAGNFSDLQQRIDQIRRAIDLRRESQEQIQGFLNDQRSLAAAKPEGWPVKGWLTSGFGPRIDPFTHKMGFHPGLDIAAHIGTPVYATADGIVVHAGISSGYGKLVVIDSGYGYRIYYGHNSKIYVKVGQRVHRGERIAAVGSTGRSTGPHCHYEVRLNGIPINPRKFL